ncbi:hypothetical protein [Erythrobacter sp. THAF29]|uniref:hypothetical protein n=1 Tax=Erythrobacter sp. THAF29 TaxID=2587851 RepID=UPI0012685E44|nr:hypothetical protein [Erythrobacter sp. THAF29]QFT78573.1 hypothetical protein FIU90_13570 [Erythrobacter sp. THAF29]
MDELQLIFTFVTVALVIVGIAINGIVSKVLDYKKSQDHHKHGVNAPVGDLAERTEIIEDRLRVLERLATDRGQLLSDEIEALRDRAIGNDKAKERA